LFSLRGVYYDELNFLLSSFPSNSSKEGREGRRLQEEVKKSQTLTSPSTSHSKVLSSTAAALYDDDNGASERSERANLECLLLESDGVSFRF